VEEPFKVRKERLIESFEREYLRELMGWASGNVSRAARKARIDRMYLHRLLVRHGIERRQFPEH
jgi:DNA-binding NtrC family response regulator